MSFIYRKGANQFALVTLVGYYHEFYSRERKKELFFVANNNLQPHKSDYHCSQFPNVFRSQLG